MDRLELLREVQRMLDHVQLFPGIQARAVLLSFPDQGVGIQFTMPSIKNASPTYPDWKNGSFQSTIRLTHQEEFDETHIMFDVTAAEISMLEHEVFEWTQLRGMKFFHPHHHSHSGGPAGYDTRLEQRLDDLTVLKAWELTYIMQHPKES